MKPANILVDRRGAVKLADFGIARQAGSALGAGETVSGSFHFMAPEQALGAPPDPRADLYAAGSTWYYALTGQMLFPGPALDALTRHRDETPPDVRRLRPEVTEKTSQLIRRLLAKDPGGRPQTADAVLAEMASASMLSNTDASGSPVPHPSSAAAAGRAREIRAPPAPAPLPSPPRLRPPLPSRLRGRDRRPFGPPPPPPPGRVRSRLAADVLRPIFAVIGPRRGRLAVADAVAEDWLALERRSSPRSRRCSRSASAGKSGARRPARLFFLGACACFARYVGTASAASPARDPRS